MAKNAFATFGILAVLLLSLGLTSAAESENNFTISINGVGSSSSNPVIGATGSDISFTVEFNNANTNYSQINISWFGSGISSGTINNINNATFNPTVNIGSGNYHTLNVEIKNGTDIIATLTRAVYYSTTPTPTNTLCNFEGYNEKGDLKISDFDVNDKGQGDDDAWQYLDPVEITVEVENTNRDNSISDVEVQMVILDDKIENGGNDVTNDFDIKDDILTSIGRLRDRDSESVTFNIDELPADLDDGTYYIYIMAYENGNEENQCTSQSKKIGNDYYYKFSVESVDYEDSVVAKPSEDEQVINTYCGQKNLDVSFPVYNLGRDKEEKVLVNIYNKEMGIDEYTIIDNLRNGKKSTASFSIDVPTQLIKNKYDLKILVNFDWDSDRVDDEDTSYSEETSDRLIKLNILECKSPAPSVTASLESTSEVGQDLIVKMTINNNGAVNDFIVTPRNFESWANLVSVTPQTSSIASQGSQEVLITLSPKKPGAQTFIISTTVDGETYNQPVSVNISEKPGIFSSLNLSGTSLYLAVGIVSLLILIFLVLIIRLTRRPSKTNF